jgi:putative tryptophan/tyrosine transport system substrate-binding protein
VRRRDVITLLGGAAVVWPFAVRAQERMRRVAVLQGGSDRDDARSQPNIVAFRQALEQLGWADGRNVKIDYRWPAGDADRARKYAAELIALAPDVILAVSAASVTPLLQATRTVPIVFVGVVDPVGAGYVNSLSRPGGNATGFALFNYGLSTKWLDLLKEIAPGLKRVAILRDSAITSGIGQFAVIQYAAPSIGLEASAIDVQDAREIERALAVFARSGDGGLIVSASPWSLAHREQIVALAARYKLPTIYFNRDFVTGGGLVSYGPDVVDLFRRAAGYVDRVLKGEKPADLPVQEPTMYKLVLNLQAAKALDLTISPTLLARADQVIE